MVRAAKNSIQKVKGMIRKPAELITISEMHAAVLDRARKENVKAMPRPKLPRG
jgi:hypothetical protein